MFNPSAPTRKHSQTIPPRYIGVGAFLLAGSEVYRMAVFENAKPLAIAGDQSSPILPPSRNGGTEPFSIGSPGIAFDKPGGDGRPRVPHSRFADLRQRIRASRRTHSFSRRIWRRGRRGPTTSWTLSALAAVPQPIVKTYARQISERYRDMAWESDRIAHRMYHQDLIPAEGTVSSGVDVWVKSTRALVINKWYKNGDYHNDHGEGLDDYRVGRSRGCGGLGIWDGHTYYVSSNYSSARIITTGPVRSEFELTYDAWEAGERKNLRNQAHHASTPVPT